MLYILMIQLMLYQLILYSYIIERQYKFSIGFIYLIQPYSHDKIHSKYSFKNLMGCTYSIKELNIDKK